MVTSYQQNALSRIRRKFANQNSFPMYYDLCDPQRKCLSVIIISFLCCCFPRITSSQSRASPTSTISSPISRSFQICHLATYTSFSSTAISWSKAFFRDRNNVPHNCRVVIWQNYVSREKIKPANLYQRSLFEISPLYRQIVLQLSSRFDHKKDLLTTCNLLFNV